jgi:hypothetical protein
MAVKRLPLLQLGGEEAFAAYQAEFDRLYRSGPVTDVLGNRIAFPPYACRHICFKPEEEDPYGRRPRAAWAQERAERIPWIHVALTDPGTEVRPSHQVEGRLAYLLLMEADPAAGYGPQYYGVFVEAISPGQVTFLTAYLLDASTWAKARRGGRRLYPPPEPPKKRRR